jgi:hypothetical protein
VIISTDIEKALNKTQYPFMKKIPRSYLYVKTKKADVKEVENRIVVTKTREGYERRKD